MLRTSFFHPGSHLPKSAISVVVSKSRHEANFRTGTILLCLLFVLVQGQQKVVVKVSKATQNTVGKMSKML